MADPLQPKPDAALEAFLAATRRVCAVLERPWEGDPAAFAQELVPELAELLVVAYSLPSVALRSRRADDEGGASIAADPAGVRVFDAGSRWYRSTFDPWVVEQPIEMDLRDDLSDIHRELSGVLALCEAGAPADELLWEARFGFWAHWGRHAVEALRALHHLCGGCPDRRGSSAAIPA